MLSVALISLIVSQAPAEPSLSAGRYWAKLLEEGRVATAWNTASPLLRGGDGKRVLTALVNARARFGQEVRCISEGLITSDTGAVYRRTSVVANYARGMELELTLDEHGRLLGGVVEGATREAPTTAGAYRTKARLRPPFEGQWSVLWGGRTWEDNRHATVPDMRYALDLLIRENGQSYRGRGKNNEDYFAWNRPVLAAGEGVVVVAEDGVPDNAPNRPRVGSLYGNFVVIDHGTGEFSLVAHLRRGSVRVRVGEPVSAGQVLGRTGNSGLSTEPHIHYHLMDHGDWALAQGLPVQFQSYVVNGHDVDRGEVRRGDLFGPLPTEARRLSTRGRDID